jgi:hypothetical protein
MVTKSGKIIVNGIKLQLKFKKRKHRHNIIDTFASINVF